MVPNLVNLWKTLRTTFALRFKHTDLAKFRYRNPTYHEKRLFISRLLAQFLHDGALVISVDETSIRSDAAHGKQWNFEPLILKKNKPKPEKRTLNPLLLSQQRIEQVVEKVK